MHKLGNWLIAVITVTQESYLPPVAKLDYEEGAPRVSEKNYFKINSERFNVKYHGNK